jgi:hypothetical protein
MVDNRRSIRKGVIALTLPHGDLMAWPGPFPPLAAVEPVYAPPKTSIDANPATVCPTNPLFLYLAVKVLFWDFIHVQDEAYICILRD